MDIQAIFTGAREKHEAAQIARKAMGDVLLETFRTLMPVGTILDLRYTRENPPPPYLASVKTLRGNDRGTRVFRIIEVVAVEADPVYPSLSTWIADAVPVSEKTGKDMLASSGHSGGRTTVRLHGKAGCEYGLNESAESPDKRVLELVMQSMAQAS